jgi:hypothetical protein
MSTVVWKFVLPMPDPEGKVRMEMPDAALPLSVGRQEQEIVVWALCDDTSTAKVEYEFTVTNTGHPIDLLPEGRDVTAWLRKTRFLGTVQMAPNLLGVEIVWHVWSHGEVERESSAPLWEQATGQS